jgi:peptide/nickel transport system permease protein
VRVGFLSRTGGALFAIFGASVVSFVFLRALPGNPARLVVGPLASEETVKQQAHAMGLDQPLYIQYWRYIYGFVRGDWGFSYTAGASVRSQIGARLPASIELGLYAFLVAVVGAVALALLATYRRRRVVDGTVRGLSFIGLGTPPFWLGLAVLLLFSEKWHVFPGPEGRLSPNTAAPPAITHLYTVDALLTGRFGTWWDATQHLVLPVFVLALAPMAYLLRLLRVNLLEVSRENFIVVARSTGASRLTAHRRHALPNAFLPTLTVSALLFAQMIGGSVLVEKVFNWPGVGALVAESVLRQDFAVVQAFVLLGAIVYVVLNLGVDVMYGVIDPRVRVGTAKE